MSRGIVLWPDVETSRRIRGLWELIAGRGVPSMATHTHRLHRPHVSLTVAGDLPVRAALDAVGAVPARSIRLLVNAAGIFPGGLLFLACVANQDLLDEQRRVHDAIRPHAAEPWPYFEPGTWTPHITSAWELTPQQIAGALPAVLDSMPIEGWLDSGGVEDGTTGESWASER